MHDLTSQEDIQQATIINLERKPKRTSSTSKNSFNKDLSNYNSNQFLIKYYLIQCIIQMTFWVILIHMLEPFIFLFIHMLMLVLPYDIICISSVIALSIYSCSI